MAFEQEQRLKIKMNTYVGGRGEPGSREPNQETTTTTREQKTKGFPWLLTMQIQKMLGLYEDKMRGSISQLWQTERLEKIFSACIPRCLVFSHFFLCLDYFYH